jgi:signal transduction histidine kinase|nr:MAG TPA: Lipopolysaccharide assembly protein A domain [Caudoviricetes sp.]
MDHSKSDRGYAWSIAITIVGVLLVVSYMIPQVFREHQIEETRMQRLERTIGKQQEEIDTLENELIRIKEDLNGNQISHPTNSNQ